VEVQDVRAGVKLLPAIGVVPYDLQSVLHHDLFAGLREVNHVGAKVFGVEVEGLGAEDALEAPDLHLVAEDDIPILAGLFVHLKEVHVVHLQGIQVSQVPVGGPCQRQDLLRLIQRKLAHEPLLDCHPLHQDLVLELLPGGLPDLLRNCDLVALCSPRLGVIVESAGLARLLYVGQVDGLEVADEVLALALQGEQSAHVLWLPLVVGALQRFQSFLDLLGRDAIQ